MRRHISRTDFLAYLDGAELTRTFFSGESARIYVWHGGSTIRVFEANHEGYFEIGCLTVAERQSEAVEDIIEAEESV